jgi:hypothetical protein
MKIYNKILSTVALLSVFIISSCEDFIENPPRGQQTLDNYFQSETECQTFINGLYKRMVKHDGWWQLTAPRLTNEMATDDAWMGNTEQDPGDNRWAALYYITPTNTGTLYNLFRIRFENITGCNYAIDGVEKSPVSESLKAKFIAEAKFCRAYEYLEMVNNFGGIPLITSPIGTDDMNRERATKEDIYEQIFADLKAASEALPEMLPSEAKGAASKGAALALLARAYLFAGDWQNAYNCANSVIESGKYRLEPDFINVWSVYNPNGVESIFEVQSGITDKGLGSDISTVAGARGENRDYFPSGDSKDVMDGWGWGVPTSDLENCYLSENDDIRRKSTITRFMDPVYGDEELNPTYYFSRAANKSMRVIRKYYIPVAMRRTLDDKWAQSPLNMPVIRLAEMYLTRAEAAWRLSNFTRATEDMNIIRRRVSLPDKTGLSGNDLLYAIWKERRMELAFEGLRLYDIRRQIDPATNKPVITSLMGPDGSFVRYNTQVSTDEYETANLIEPQDKGIMFDENKHLLWPIPQAEIDRGMGLIKQNPGYN